MATDGNGSGINRSTVLIIMGAAGLVITIAGGCLQSQNLATNNRIDEAKTEIVALRAVINDLRPLVAERGKEIGRLDLDIKRIDATLLRHDADIVRREEHKEKQAKEDAVIADLRRQTEENKRRWDELFPVARVFDDIMKRLSGLESRRPAP